MGLFKLLPWASQSPDLNLWAEMKRRVHKRGPGLFNTNTYSNYFIIAKSG